MPARNVHTNTTLPNVKIKNLGIMIIHVGKLQGIDSQSLIRSTDFASCLAPEHDLVVSMPVCLPGKTRRDKHPANLHMHGSERRAPGKRMKMHPDPKGICSQSRSDQN